MLSPYLDLPPPSRTLREAVEQMIASRAAEAERTKNPVRRAKLQKEIAELRSALGGASP